MNENNLEYLKKSLDYLGFGTKLNDILESAIARDVPAFTLGVNQSYTPAHLRKTPSAGSDQVQFRLNFNRSKQSDMYFLNDYEVTLNRPGNPVAIRQVFDLERDHRVTALQAYKLLSSNSLERDIQVKKEGAEQPEKKKVWFKLDLDVLDAYGNHPLKRYFPEFNFDLSDAIGKYPFKAMDDKKLETMMKLLRNGNLAQADLMVGKKAVPVFVSANPQFKGLDVYDKNMSVIRQDEIFPERAEQRRQAASEKGLSVAAPDERFPWETSDEQDISAGEQISR